MRGLSFEGPVVDAATMSDCLHAMIEAAVNNNEDRGIFYEEWPFDNRWRMTFDPKVPRGSITRISYSSPAPQED